MNNEAEQLILRLGLSPLPGEGGFFASTWTSPMKDPSGRAYGSAILFLMTPEGFSALHRLKTDEIWHFHAGDPVEHLQIDPSTGALHRTLLGPDPLGAHVSQVTAKAGFWQGARLVPGTCVRGWALFGCTLAPAWDQAEFELGSRADLLRDFPAHGDAIASLTRLQEG